MQLDRRSLRSLRHKRILRRVRDGNERIRIRITKSNSHVYVQAIEDAAQRTIASSSTLSLKLKNGNQENCRKMAEDLCKKLKNLKIKDLAIDRGGHSYRGRVETIANALRKEGFNL